MFQIFIVVVGSSSMLNDNLNTKLGQINSKVVKIISSSANSPTSQLASRTQHEGLRRSCEDHEVRRIIILKFSCFVRVESRETQKGKIKRSNDQKIKKTKRKIKEEKEKDGNLCSQIINK